MVLPSPNVLCTHAAYQEHTTAMAGQETSTCCRLLSTYSSVSFCKGTESSPQSITCIRLLMSSLDLALPRPAIGNNTRRSHTTSTVLSKTAVLKGTTVKRQCAFSWALCYDFQLKMPAWKRCPACSSSSLLTCST